MVHERANLSRKEVASDEIDREISALALDKDGGAVANKEGVDTSRESVQLQRCYPVGEPTLLTGSQGARTMALLVDLDWRRQLEVPIGRQLKVLLN